MGLFSSLYIENLKTNMAYAKKELASTRERKKRDMAVYTDRLKLAKTKTEKDRIRKDKEYQMKVYDNIIASLTSKINSYKADIARSK